MKDTPYDGRWCRYFVFHQEEMSIPYHFLLNIVKAICSLICAFLCEDRFILRLNIFILLLKIYRYNQMLLGTKTINVYLYLLNEHRFMANVLNDSAHSFALTLFSWQRRKQFDLEITRIMSNVKYVYEKTRNNKISNQPTLLLPRQTII